METEQRHAEATIPPFTREWSGRRQLGFGVLACIPAFLLVSTFLCWFLSGVGVGTPFTWELLPLLFYTHIGAQFITLLVFGHLMVANPELSGAAKLVWGVGFLFLAPFAIPTYWALHVWQEEPTVPSEAQQRPPTRQIHVYDYDYRTHQRGRERRPDGAIIHHLDAS